MNPHPMAVVAEFISPVGMLFVAICIRLVFVRFHRSRELRTYYVSVHTPGCMDTGLFIKAISFSHAVSKVEKHTTSGQRISVAFEE